MSAKDNPQYMCDRGWLPEELFEGIVYDNSKAPQGKVLWKVLSVQDHSQDGQWLTCRMICVEDRNLKWWITKGEGKSYKMEFYIHICAAELSKCRCYDRRAKDEFHMDYLRMVSDEDVRNRRALWWQTGVAKGDFELFHKENAQSSGSKGPRGSGADAEAFPLGDEGDPPAAAAASGVEALQAQVELEKELARLKGEAAGDPKKPAKEKRVEAQDDKGKKKKKKEASSSPEVRPKKSGKSPQPGWFGQEAKKPKVVESSGEEEKTRKRKAKERSSSPEKKKKKSKKKADRGPFGAGEKLSFGGGVSDFSSTSSDEEESFQGGASDKRSHQLQLVEYAQRRPGRLTSRLLLKMQGLLSRDTGAPFNLQAERITMTPPAATAYLLTILVPTLQGRMGQRTLREFRTIAGAVDEIAKGNFRVAADLLTQRLKALELSMTDNGWDRASFLELIPPEGAGLAERGEQGMAAREQANEMKMRGGYQGRGNWNYEGKGKNDQRPKGRGKKGAKNQKGQDNHEKPPPA